MRRYTTLRRCVVSAPRAAIRLVQHSVVQRRVGLCVGASYVVLACAPPTRYEQPAALRGYDILITRRDSLAQGIAAGLRHHGFRVRDRVRGGSQPTAYLLAFTFRETEASALTWLHVRLADTRTGTIVVAVSAPLDALGATAADHARAVVDSLVASATLRRPVSPP
ncbi:MAG TPA: hypothetical protein VK531_14195 [Gemmatimonadales bacterium]|nr:hypothetical protein [Gemmatimonadales bacterium]